MQIGFVRIAEVLAVRKDRLHVRTEMAIDPLEGFVISCPRGQDVLQRKTIVGG